MYTNELLERAYAKLNKSVLRAIDPDVLIRHLFEEQVISRNRLFEIE
jgi:hypothetical protein